MSQILHRRRLQAREEPDEPALVLADNEPEPEPTEIFQEPENSTITVPPSNTPGPVTNPAATIVGVTPATIPAAKIHTEASSIQVSPGGASIATVPGPQGQQGAEQQLGEGDGFVFDPLAIGMRPAAGS